jgi:hypothetical protein
MIDRGRQLGSRSLIAFLGPSLPDAEARRLAPTAETVPRICRGDLAGVVERVTPRGVLIVDGEFGQSRSVWRREILHRPVSWRPGRGCFVDGRAARTSGRRTDREAKKHATVKGKYRR